MTLAKRVAVTGAAGQIGYSLLPRIANGEKFRVQDAVFLVVSQRRLRKCPHRPAGCGQHRLGGTDIPLRRRPEPRIQVRPSTS